jgi:hypothetical protein
MDDRWRPSRRTCSTPRIVSLWWPCRRVAGLDLLPCPPAGSPRGRGVEAEANIRQTNVLGNAGQKELG